MSSRVEYALLDGHRIIQGPGIDHVLEGINSILLVDDYYADIYGDYIFLGYDTYHTSITPAIADLVNLYTAAQILSQKPCVVVCGDSPQRCIYALAAYLVYARGFEPRDAISRAVGILRQIYPDELLKPKSRAAYAALLALHRAVKLFGATRFSIIMSLASNYGWGWSDTHYSEHVSWVAALNADDPTLAASLLHFLTEGPGSEEELLRIRLETLGERNIRELLGNLADETLSVLREYARKTREPRAALLWFVEKLEPGKGYILLAGRDADTINVYCRGAEGIPDRACVERVKEAAQVLRDAGYREAPRIRIADWL